MAGLKAIGGREKARPDQDPRGGNGECLPYAIAIAATILLTIIFIST